LDRNSYDHRRVAPSPSISRAPPKKCPPT
ncbi:hypothetical protein TorRG33x02_338480, partial [Trema orientale]